MTLLTLRDYQEDALDRIAKREADGVRRQLGQAATGLGKTVIFCALAERRGCRTLILAHRDELVTQAVAKVREIWPGIEPGIVKAGDNHVHSHVVVASVQTLSRPKRLAQLVASQEPNAMVRTEPFGLVVVDEAHHAAADSYRTVLAGLRAGEDDGPLLLGVTATPDRGDGKGLDDLFDEIVFTYDILWGIRSGYLSDLRGLLVKLEQLDLSRVKVTAGDYNVGQAGAAMEEAGAPSHIVRAWSIHARDRRTLVFTPTVQLAADTAHEFQSKGVACDWISGETPLDERRRKLERFQSGECQVMVNCAVLTEGYDNPAVDCIVVARPTKSRALYVQMVGRGTRRHPGKDDCLVLDIVGATDEHSLLTIPSLFGIDPKEMKKGLSVVQAVEEREAEQVRLGQITAHEAELFKQVRAQALAWVKAGADFALSFGRYNLYLRPDPDSGLWTALALKYQGKDSAGRRIPDRSKVFIADVSLEIAQGVAEDFVRTRSREDRNEHIVDANAEWRGRKPTRKQSEMARRLHIKVEPAMTAGDLSDQITAKLAERRARRAEL